MRIVIQRVLDASVTIDGRMHSSIGRGLLVLLGITHDDQEEDVQWLVRKVAALRIFDDPDGVMNLDVRQTGGDVLVVSQFTLMAMTKKGNRPSYIKAAGEEVAIPLYEEFLRQMAAAMGKEVFAGVFGADMKVALTNDGPVTIVIDSKARE